MRTFLSFLCVFIIVAFPIAMFSIAPSIDLSVEKNNEEYHLAHLDIKFQGDHQNLIPTIRNLIGEQDLFSQYELELRATTNYQIFHKDNWYYTNIVAFNASNLPNINQFHLTKGSLPNGINEGLILETYAEELNVSLGDHISVYTPIGIEIVDIVGFVESIEFLSYQLSLEGALFIEYETYQYYNSLDKLEFNSAVLYFEEEPDLKSLINLSDQIREELQSESIQIYYFWYVREFSTSAMFQDVLGMTSQLLSIMACTVILLAGIIIYIITKRFAVEQQKQTGMLYAYGYSPTTILKSFMLRTLIISIISIIFGILMSYLLLNIICHFLGKRWGIIDLSTFLSPMALFLIPILVLSITQFFTYFACKSNVNMSPYEAIRGKTKEKQNSHEIKKSKTKKIREKFESFISIQIKYPLRNLKRNRKRGTLTTLAFIGAIVISFALIQTESSIDKTFDNFYSEQLNWNIKSEFNSFESPDIVKNISDKYPNIDEIEPFLELGVEPIEHPELRVQIHGIVPNSKLLLIDLQQGSLFSDEMAHEGIMSSYIAEPLGINVGDQFEFWLLSNKYTIKIVGICRDLDSHTSLYMNLPALSNLMGINPINGVYIKTGSLKSDEMDQIILDLNNEPNIQHAINKLSYEYQTEQMVDSQTMIVKVMITLALVISFITIFVIAFISVIERNREIALLRVFGFSKKQIIGQIFIEIGILITIAVIFGFILGGEGLGRIFTKIISDMFFEVSIYREILNYLTILGFSTFCAVFATIPGINLLRKQNMAESIADE